VIGRHQDHRMNGQDPARLRIEDAVNQTCPWSGKPVSADSLTLYNGAVVGFCNPGCRDKFEQAVRHFEGALQARRAATAGNDE
jgi:hypothetical protein